MRTKRRKAIGAAAAALLAALLPAAAPAADRCPRSAALHPRPTHGPLYETVAPFEHHDVLRTHVFPYTCSLAELGGPAIRVRRAPQRYPKPYTAQTRDRDELFVFSYGLRSGTDGATVAAVDTATLAERWRTRFTDPPPGEWSWPGVVTVHGNGFLYAVYANRLVKLDPADGAILAERVLPEGPYGAVYNGMTILPDGRIAAKGMESPPVCPPTAVAQLLDPDPNSQIARLGEIVETLGGLFCHALLNDRPSTLTVLDPERLDLVAQTVMPEPVTGRISSEMHDGRSYLYVAGATTLYRYEYDGAGVALDPAWGPVTYVEPGQGPAAGPAFLRGFVVLHVNGLARPGSLVAVDVRDSRRQYRIDPFGPAGLPSPTGPSFVISKPAVDEANGLVVAIDSLAGQLGAVAFDPQSGFTPRWARAILSLDFPALVGPPEDREVVITDSLPAGSQRGDRVIWLDAATGALRARSEVVGSSLAPGNIVTPGFDGRFYYLGGAGELAELSPGAVEE